MQAKAPTDYKVGQQPGKGTYVCTTCNDWQVILDDDSDPLPACGTCGRGPEVRYRKVEDWPSSTTGDGGLPFSRDEAIRRSCTSGG